MWKVVAYHNYKNSILLLVVLVFLHLSFWRPVAYHNKRRKYIFFIFLNPKTVDPTTSVHNNPYQTTIYYMYLLHCVNSSTLARLRTTKLKKLYIYIYIYIYIYAKFFRHTYTYTYIRKRTPFGNLQKRKHDMSDLFQTTAASKMNPFFQAGIGIAFDMHRSCPTPVGVRRGGKTIARGEGRTHPPTLKTKWPPL